MERIHRPVRLEPRPLAIILPQKAASEKFAREGDDEQEVDDELEEAEKTNFFFRSRVSFFWTNLFSSRQLLLALILALQPCLM